MCFDPVRFHAGDRSDPFTLIGGLFHGEISVGNAVDSSSLKVRGETRHTSVAGFERWDGSQSFRKTRGGGRRRHLGADAAGSATPPSRPPASPAALSKSRWDPGRAARSLSLSEHSALQEGIDITIRCHRNGYATAMAVSTSEAIGLQEYCVFHHFGIGSSTQAASRYIDVQQSVDQPGKRSNSCIRQVSSMPMMFPMFAAPSSIQEQC